MSAISSTTVRSSRSSLRRRFARSGRGRSRKTRSANGGGMSTELPLYRQQKDNTYALACQSLVRRQKGELGEWHGGGNIQFSGHGEKEMAAGPFRTDYRVWA